MAVLIDPPRWPAHGRLWSHLVTDTELTELHAFARANDIPDADSTTITTTCPATATTRW